MLYSAVATTSASTTAYGLAAALTVEQTFDLIWIAIILGIIGVLLIEERLLIFIVRAPGRLRKSRSTPIEEMTVTTNREYIPLAPDPRL